MRSEGEKEEVEEKGGKQDHLDLRPILCNLFGTIGMVQLCSVLGTLYMAGPGWCNVSGGRNVVQSMCCNFHGRTYMVQSTLCNGCGEVYDAQAWCIGCG